MTETALFFDGSSSCTERVRHWVPACAVAVVDECPSGLKIQHNGMTTIVRPFDWIVFSPKGFRTTNDIITYP